MFIVFRYNLGKIVLAWNASDKVPVKSFEA